MKKLIIALVIAQLSVFAGAKPAKTENAAKAPAAEKADKYQVTGSVSEVTDTKIVVMKGTTRNEFARNADTKVDGGELKVGSKVTVKYVMTAATVEVKPEAAKPADKKADKKAEPKAEKKDEAKPAEGAVKAAEPAAEKK